MIEFAFIIVLKVILIVAVCTIALPVLAYLTAKFWAAGYFREKKKQQNKQH